MGKVNPQDIIVWAQVGGQMVQLATTAIGNVKAIMAASGADAAAQDRKLAETKRLYDAAIAHEEHIAAGQTEA